MRSRVLDLGLKVQRAASFGSPLLFAEGYHRSMQRFDTDREAKEFLVSRIVAESQRVGVPLSEVEEKMLYFSETDWTLPDIWEVNAAFDKDYEQDAYEQKIAGLIRSLLSDARKRSKNDLDAWKEAVRVLRRGDHYLLVMVDVADGSVASIGTDNRGVSFWKLLAVSVGFFFICFAIAIGYVLLRR